MVSQGRIILANNSRLVRDMLRKVIDKAPGLEIVSEVEDLDSFSNAVSQTQADWAIVLLYPDEEVPQLVEDVIKEHSSMRFLIMGVDGSHARMKWSEPHEIPLEEKNLSELLDIMRQEFPQNTTNERIKA